MLINHNLIRLKSYLEKGSSSSPQIQRQLDISQATVSRLLDKCGVELVRIGKGRSTQYALAKEIAGGNYRIPIYEVFSNKPATEVALLSQLAHGGYYVDTHESSEMWLKGEAGNGLFDGLPYYLNDLKPQGFLGKQIAKNLSASNTYPSDLRLWPDKYVLNYLMFDAIDYPGNLVVGNRALDRIAGQQPRIIKNRKITYPKEALRVLSGDEVGSSAAGEQPKFLAYTEKGHVIVKFSPAGGTSESIRWRDLLIAEAAALKIISKKLNIDAAVPTLYEYEGRLFLESPRFDRQGEKGHFRALSLAVVDSEYTGLGENWSAIAKALNKQKLLSNNDYRTIERIQLLGKWIGNNDMHTGNLAVKPVQSGFKLLKLYDMLPMQYAPKRGELPSPGYTAPNIPKSEKERGDWKEVANAAAIYWLTLTKEKKLSNSFREIAKNAATKCYCAINENQQIKKAGFER